MTEGIKEKAGQIYFLFVGRPDLRAATQGRSYIGFGIMAGTARRAPTIHRSTFSVIRFHRRGVIHHALLCPQDGRNALRPLSAFLMARDCCNGPCARGTVFP